MITGRKMTTRSLWIRVDDHRAYQYACPQCHSDPEQQCTTLVTENQRKPMKLIHHARTDLVRSGRSKLA